MIRLLSLLLVAGFAVRSVAADEVVEWVDAQTPSLVEFYKELHAAPELSLEEHKTAAKIADAWEAAGYTVTRGVGGTGVVAVLENGDGPTVMLRTDLDGLPVVEQTGLDYASTVRTTDKRGAVVGVMHACGHDVHMTNLVGVSRCLTENKNLWKGTLVCIAQPAEELGAGAEAMLADGLFARFPRPDYAIALHAANDLEAGKVSTCPGFFGANVDSVDITVRGKGGHGAAPHTAIDPVVIAARLVLDLQTIVSRELKPTEPAVITVGSIHGGTKHNVIGDDVKLQLTVRTYSADIRKQIAEAIERKAKAAAASADAPDPEIVYSEGTPSLYNDPDLTTRVDGVLRKTLGDGSVNKAEPMMGAEDFSRYGKAGVPICMFRLGTISKERLDAWKAAGETPPSMHSSLYWPNPEPTLRTGVQAMTAIVLDLMPR
ncbi:amidohydrolase [Botrimarina mediterranea]|uniref:Putative hydrolase YxeP n=1 Tax=Botrimarina mediterranea TaxID=2528022 RepID=A0A518K5D5_9BACT|nr:amidohydrolase [Botrimarina mediterranea]QDV73012.1 putative hydrolase YxeP [Botrimarina mediterranea]QDV77586.1 putative hydrolase YxeP [Planctomycetes bacterium K2D]